MTDDFVYKQNGNGFSTNDREKIIKYAMYNAGNSVVSAIGWNGKHHNVWSSTLRTIDYAGVLGITALEMTHRWADECKKTFQLTETLPEPVSASKMAHTWHVSHVTAKRLITADWEWICVTERQYLHISHLNNIMKKCIRSKNPICAIRTVNKLQNLSVFPTRENIIKIIGQRAFQVIVEAQILIPIKTLTGRTKLYFLRSE